MKHLILLAVLLSVFGCYFHYKPAYYKTTRTYETKPLQPKVPNIRKQETTINQLIENILSKKI